MHRTVYNVKLNAKRIQIIGHDCKAKTLVRSYDKEFNFFKLKLYMQLYK